MISTVLLSNSTALFASARKIFKGLFVSGRALISALFMSYHKA